MGRLRRPAPCRLRSLAHREATGGYAHRGSCESFCSCRPPRLELPPSSPRVSGGGGGRPRRAGSEEQEGRARSPAPGHRASRRGGSRGSLRRRREVLRARRARGTHVEALVRGRSKLHARRSGRSGRSARLAQPDRLFADVDAADVAVLREEAERHPGRARDVEDACSGRPLPLEVALHPLGDEVPPARGTTSSVPLTSNILSNSPAVSMAWARGPHACSRARPAKASATRPMPAAATAVAAPSGSGWASSHAPVDARRPLCRQSSASIGATSMRCTCRSRSAGECHVAAGSPIQGARAPARTRSHATPSRSARGDGRRARRLRAPPVEPQRRLRRRRAGEHRCRLCEDAARGKLQEKKPSAPCRRARRAGSRAPCSPSSERRRRRVEQRERRRPGAQSVDVVDRVGRRGPARRAARSRKHPDHGAGTRPSARAATRATSVSSARPRPQRLSAGVVQQRRPPAPSEAAAQERRRRAARRRPPERTRARREPTSAASSSAARSPPAAPASRAACAGRAGRRSAPAARASGASSVRRGERHAAAPSQRGEAAARASVGSCRDPPPVGGALIGGARAARSS